MTSIHMSRSAAPSAPERENTSSGTGHTPCRNWTMKLNSRLAL
jgi:hypothetical protein